MRIFDIVDVAKKVLGLRKNLAHPPTTERTMDPLLFAYLSGRFSFVQRQHNVHSYGSPIPERIDFRFGSSNPVVLELAVRPPKGGGHLLGSQNASELRKLCRVSCTEARLRALLLLDLCDKPLTNETLEATYKAIHAGPGKFRRSPVRVIYVHPMRTFNFPWSPFKS